MIEAAWRRVSVGVDLSVVPGERIFFRADALPRHQTLADETDSSCCNLLSGILIEEASFFRAAALQRHQTLADETDSSSWNLLSGILIKEASSLSHSPGVFPLQCSESRIFLRSATSMTTLPCDKLQWVISAVRALTLPCDSSNAQNLSVHQASVTYHMHSLLEFGLFSGIFCGHSPTATWHNVSSPAVPKVSILMVVWVLLQWGELQSAIVQRGRVGTQALCMFSLAILLSASPMTTIFIWHEKFAWPGYPFTFFCTAYFSGPSVSGMTNILSTPRLRRHDIHFVCTKTQRQGQNFVPTGICNFHAPWVSARCDPHNLQLFWYIVGMASISYLGVIQVLSF